MLATRFDVSNVFDGRCQRCCCGAAEVRRMSKRKPDQTQIFSKDEGDNWFARNQPALNKAQDDRAVAMAVRWAGQTRVRSVCELGCSNGWRLAALRDAIPELQRCAGADVSEVAIS